jgi:HK97 family phage portal protein
MGIFSRRTDNAATQKRELADITIPAREAYTLEPDDAVRRLSAVFRCIQVISHTGANLDIERFAGDHNMGKFRGFADGMSDREFLTSTFVSLAAWGNAYWRKPTLKLKSWRYQDVIHPDRILLQTDGTYAVTNAVTKKREILTPDQITHIKFLTVPGATRGASPLGSLRSTLSFARDLNDYAGSVYTSGAYPSGYLTTEQQLPAPVADDIKKRWTEKFAKAEREVAVMSGGVKYEPLTINPTDAAFVESFNLSVQDIARAFGVPASFMGVGSGDSLTYSTAESETARFIQTTLTAYTAPVEEAFSNDRGGSADVIEFNFDSLLRADIGSRFAAYKTAIDGGWMTPGEIRVREGLPAQMTSGGNA